VKQIAAKKGCSPAQLALAWVLGQGNDVVPIPGTKRVKYLEDNMGAVKVQLTDSDRQEIDERCRDIEVVGDRYTPEMMALIDQ
jgi:aryl-alcohol dehydrogenase-like predicted oxidoreductase